jgi:hypothetical protein
MRALLRKIWPVAWLLAGSLVPGCGDNIGGPGVDILLGLPRNLKAVSADETHVRIFWSESADAASTDFAGYVVSYGSVSDSLSKSTLEYLAGPLSPGARVFTVRSLKANGQVSNPATILWAPAFRFDARPLVLLERDPGDATRICGVHAGTESTDPFSLEVDATSQPDLDFFLDGLGGQPLLLRGATEFASNWKLTLFSTESDSGTSLDFPRSTFPADGTFTLTRVTIEDNTIFYAKIVGDSGQSLAVRIHVRFLAGDFPDRSVEITLSLQRSAGVPFALLVPSLPGVRGCSGGAQG